MRNDHYLHNTPMGSRFASFSENLPRKATVGVILMVALLAFEIFNFDTTQYALRNLLGEIRFLGLQWATILAVAFCSIDFAGLIRLFTPQQGSDEPKEVWYLMGAWLLGATMNAVMTWWAISLTLLNHDFGNEVLGREQLLRAVPIFVAVLVWLTRILFIGAFTVAGEHLFEFSQSSNRRPLPVRGLPARAAQPAHPAQVQASAPVRAVPKREPQSTRHTTQQRPVAVQRPLVVEEVPIFPDDYEPATADERPSVSRQPERAPSRPPASQVNSRVRQRPPRPNGFHRTPSGVHARSRDTH